MTGFARYIATANTPDGFNIVPGAGHSCTVAAIAGRLSRRIDGTIDMRSMGTVVCTVASGAVDTNDRKVFGMGIVNTTRSGFGQHAVISSIVVTRGASRRAAVPVGGLEITTTVGMAVNVRTNTGATGETDTGIVARQTGGIEYDIFVAIDVSTADGTRLQRDAVNRRRVVAVGTREGLAHRQRAAAQVLGMYCGISARTHRGHVITVTNLTFGPGTDNGVGTISPNRIGNRVGYDTVTRVAV